MELREFVRDTLVAVIDGVRDAQTGLAKDFVNPEPSDRSNKFGGDYVTSEGHRAYPVKFDVAVTVSAESQKAGGGKISVLAFGGFDGNASLRGSESSVSRLQFQVPVSFPYGDAPALRTAISR